MKSKKSQRAKRRQQQKRLTSLAFIVSGGLVVALALWSFLGKGTAPKAAIEVTGAPGLKVDQEQVNLGDVKLGKTVNAAFQVTNVGDQPLRFQKQPYIEVVEGC